MHRSRLSLPTAEARATAQSPVIPSGARLRAKSRNLAAAALAGQSTARPLGPDSSASLGMTTGGAALLARHVRGTGGKAVPALSGRKSLSPCRAFTLIELLVVISVISILAGLLLVAVRIASGSSKINSTKSMIAEVGMALEFYRQSHDSLPPERNGYQGQDLVSSECLAFFLGGVEKFVQLKKVATADTDGQGEPELLDAWGRPLLYNRWHFAGEPVSVFVGGSNHTTYATIHNAKSFDLFSAGPLAHHIPRLNPTPARVASLEFDKDATEIADPPMAYLREEIKVGKKMNKYIGNW